LEGKLDVINAAHLIHVFNLDDQRLLIARFMGLLSEGKRRMVTGRMTGHLEAGYKGGANVRSTTKSGGEIGSIIVRVLRGRGGNLVRRGARSGM
jgi:hypothetical protein